MDNDFNIQKFLFKFYLWFFKIFEQVSNNSLLKSSEYSKKRLQLSVNHQADNEKLELWKEEISCNDDLVRDLLIIIMAYYQLQFILNLDSMLLLNISFSSFE